MGRRERLRWGDGEGGNREEEGKEEKSWQGPGVGRKVGGGRVDKKEWGGDGETGLGQWGGDWKGAMGRGRWRGATGRGRWGGEQQEGGDGRGAKGRSEEGARGGDILQMDMI